MMADQILIEDGIERALTLKQAEHLAGKKLIDRCPSCGSTIWRFRDESTSFEEIDTELILLGRRKANVSGQDGEDREHILAAMRERNAGVAVVDASVPDGAKP
jgi:hypothetical protein